MEAMPSGWELAGFLLKALTYIAALSGVGGALFLSIFSTLSPLERRRIENVTAAIALTGAVLTVLALPWQVGLLSGEGFAGMFDRMFLAMLLGSSFGTSLLLRSLGLCLVAAVLLRRWAGYWIGAVGAALVVVSFAMTGHTTSFEPRLLGGALIALHLAAVAYWVGALWPLLLISRAVDHERSAAILERFGTIAVGLVGMLVLAGSVLAWLFLGSIAAFWETRYGNMLALKLAVFAGLLALAALNRFRLVPALAAGAANADGALRRSIGIEAVAVVLIVTTTSALTSFSSPF